ncbi:ABC transporter permease [Pelagicoccus albus]|uniref:ABC transporter permease n=1 Tax=Pelagicoccus albus TaxID=415222 RepID=A0A7X1B8Z4_9BACT|nr:ABC transporter permease [Pelagicoccus albus]MBC2607902.1 ABC transporter permease [Pelagicoccus albus]
MKSLPLFATLGSILLAVLVGALLLGLSGFDPWGSYLKLFEGATGLDFSGRGSFFRIPSRLGSTLNECAPLLLAALAVATPWRLGWVNLGGEGQMIMGAAAATMVALSFSEVASPGILVFALLAAAIAGALWSLLAAWTRIHRGMNEIIVTIMLNFIAFWFVAWLVHGPMRDTESGMGHPWSPPVPLESQLPILGGDIRFHSGLIIAPVLAILIWILQTYRVSGFQEQVTGRARPTALFAGFPVRKLEYRAMAIGGACAGLGGACALLGVQFRLSEEVATGYGFTGLTIALAARSHPLAIIPCALFFATLRTGAEYMEFSAGIPQTLAVIIQALVLFFLLLALAPQWKKWWQQHKTRQASLRKKAIVEGGANV